MTYGTYVERTETRTDTISADMLHRMAATLGVPVPEQVPPGWHWTLFQDWAAPGGLGPDGHPRRGGFLPPVHDLPRRMWAGGEVRLLAPLHPGDAVTRTSTIRAVQDKQGGTGRLVFVTVDHVIAGPHGPAIEERQDLVYRGADGAAVKPGDPAPNIEANQDRTVLPDPVLLFRYSVLTGNGHRIHYDADYVRGEEGYPGLVVHGPLQATWMAALPGTPLSRFSFRGRRPAFAGAPLRMQAWRNGAGWRMRTLDPSGAVCMEGEAAPCS
jgi:3-methylfumaryl-CoA hydratase